MYSLLAIGVHIHMHYCCGKLASVQFFDQKETCCSHDEDDHAGAAIEAKCCSNESLNINLNAEHEAFSWNPQVSSHVALSVAVAQPEVSCFVSKSVFVSNKANAPPAKIPIYLSIQSLIYYA